MSTGPLPPDAAAERETAVRLFNATWGYLSRTDRTADDDAAMIHLAHASLHHWAAAGGRQELARGEWLCARVYAELGRAEPALYHATRCLRLNEAGPDRADWDLAAAYESMARASRVAGRTEESERWLRRAEAELPRIAGVEDREIIERDLATLR